MLYIRNYGNYGSYMLHLWNLTSLIMYIYLQIYKINYSYIYHVPGYFLLTFDRKITSLNAELSTPYSTAPK